MLTCILGYNTMAHSFICPRIMFIFRVKLDDKTRKHSSRMRTDHTITRMSSDRVAMRPIVNRMTDRHM